MRNWAGPANRHRSSQPQHDSARTGDSPPNPRPLMGAAGNDTYAFRGTGDGSDTINDASGTDSIMIGTNGATLTALNFADDNNGSGGNLVITYGAAEQITERNSRVALGAAPFSGRRCFSLSAHWQ